MFKSYLYLFDLYNKYNIKKNAQKLVEIPFCC